jgi:hypothetical protein
MLKSELLHAIQQEIQRHDFSHFVERPPSVSQGGKGVVVPGCPTCKKRSNTMPQSLDHLADDVLRGWIDYPPTRRHSPVAGCRIRRTEADASREQIWIARNVFDASIGST